MDGSNNRPTTTIAVLRVTLKNDLLVKLTLAVAISIFVVLHLLPTSQRSLFVSRCVTASFLVLAVVALRHDLLRVSGKSERYFWQHLTIAYCSWLGADLVLLGAALRGTSSGGKLAAELGAALFYVFLVSGIERQPHRPSGRACELTRRLNLLAIAAFVFSLLTYFILIPIMTDRGSEESFLPSVYFYATVDIMLTIRLFYLILSTRSARWRMIYALLMTTTGAMAVGDFVGSYTSLTEANYLYGASMITVILAARLKSYRFTRGETVQTASSQVDSHQGWQTVVYTLILPLLHLVIYRFGLLDSAIRPWRETFVLLWTPLLGAIALLQHRDVERERKRVVDELEIKNAEMERFTYTVSHDLKSPLVTIQGFLGLLSQDMIADDRDRVESDLRQIKNAAGQMGRLLDELLELSRVSRVVNRPQDVSLRELAAEAVELVATKIRKRGVEVEISPDLPVVSGDRARLLQVFQNLVENAVKYMGPQPDPRIEISVRWQEGESVYYVLDNGIGIDPRYHEKVFGLFDRLETSVEGTGVGLALVKQIVELHGGRIWIESEGEGRGCAVCITLGTSGS